MRRCVAPAVNGPRAGREVPPSREMMAGASGGTSPLRRKTWGRVGRFSERRVDWVVFWVTRVLVMVLVVLSLMVVLVVLSLVFVLE